MKSISLILCFLLSGSLHAQRRFTLSECIEQALKSNVDIKRQKGQVDKQAIQTETQQYSRLPNLNLDGTQKFDFGRSLNRENTYDDMNSQTSSFSLNAEMAIFSGFKT